MVHTPKQQGGECCSLMLQVSDRNLTQKMIAVESLWNTDRSGMMKDRNVWLTGMKRNDLVQKTRPCSSLDESSLHKNPYFDLSYAQVASEIIILFTLYHSKMTPGSQMMLQKLFYVIFGLGGEIILKYICK